ncbi:DUF1275 family protein [Streptomyces sp. NPDC054834]
MSIALCALTVTSGAIDAITFLGLGHAFATLATGNLLLLGFGVARAPGIAAARPAEAPAAFVAGATASQVLIARSSRRGRRWFVIALTAEVAVLCATGLYAVAADGTGQLPGHSVALTAVLLAFAMGRRTRVINEAGIPTCPPQPSRSRW